VTCFSFLGYLAFLYVMYVVSMPKAEAFIVAEFDRYFKTIVLFGLYLLLFLTTRLPEPAEQPARKRRILAVVSYAVAALVSIGMIASVGSRCFARQDYTASERYYLETLIERYQIQDDASYLFVISGANDYYMQYLGLYTFRTQQLNTITKEEIAGFSDWSEYRYVICMHLADEDKAQIFAQLGETESNQPLPDVFVQD